MLTSNRQEELVLNASSDITSSLKRTHTLLVSELSRSQFATETLSQSTQALKELSHRYSTFDDLLLKSRKLITDLVRKNKSDAWYYEKAIYIMVTTILWLIVRRFLYGPFYLFIWVPLKLCWWVLSLFASIIGAGDDGPSVILGGRGRGRDLWQSGGGDGNIAINSAKMDIRGVLEDLPQIPQSLIAAQSVAPHEPISIAAETNSHRRLHPLPFTPFTEKMSLLEKVGQALDAQCGKSETREYATAVQETGHDEL